MGTLIGNTGFGIGAGASNTKKIMAGCSTSNIAARRAGNLTFGGQNDWFLPSRFELNQMYVNLHSVGGFESDRYWSSSENLVIGSNGWAANQRLFDGNVSSGFKSAGLFVRPIRAFG